MHAGAAKGALLTVAAAGGFDAASWAGVGIALTAVLVAIWIPTKQGSATRLKDMFRQGRESRQGEIDTLRSEKNAELANLRDQVTNSQSALASMERDRDFWRSQVYGGRQS